MRLYHKYYILSTLKTQAVLLLLLLFGLVQLSYTQARLTKIKLMDKEVMFRLKEALQTIVYDAEAVLKAPQENHHRLEAIVAVAQKQLKAIKAEEEGMAHR